MPWGSSECSTVRRGTSGGTERHERRPVGAVQHAAAPARTLLARAETWYRLAIAASPRKRNVP